MKSYNTTAFSIALKIWLVALCCHTLAGSFLLSDDVYAFLFIALLGGCIGGFFSAPVFVLLWVVLYYFLKKGRPAYFIFKMLLTIGIAAAFLASALFLYMGGIGSTRASNLLFFFLPPACGAIAILIHYQSLQTACLNRDEACLLHPFDTTIKNTASL